MRYRLEQLQANAVTDFKSFAVDKVGMVSATCEGIGEVFDVELGL